MPTRIPRGGSRIMFTALIGVFLLNMMAASADPAATVPTQICGPLLASNEYSAAGRSAADIDAWVQAELKPNLFDIWCQKKARIYLNGSWKFIKLDATRDDPDNAFGETNGFQRADFDDAAWFNQPVPWVWTRAFPDGGVIKNWGGVAWYRRAFLVPGDWSGQRVFLRFEAVDHDCVVYVNGRKIGEHHNIQGEYGAISLRGRAEESFEFDITDAVQGGQTNVLAVRVYNAGRHKSYLKAGGYHQDVPAGIWQEVVLESRPAVYVRCALITPAPAKSSIQVKAYVVNTTGRAVQRRLVAGLKPWNSDRYQRPDGGDLASADLGKFDLLPNENEITFSVPVSKPRYWSPADPYLYHFLLMDDQGAVLGQERFGFREFIAGERGFFLNGKPITLRGMSAEWGSWQTTPTFEMLMGRMGVMNRNRNLEDWFRVYLDSNQNFFRLNSVLPPRVYYDIGDEVGALVYDEESPEIREPRRFQGEQLTPMYREKIRGRVEAQYNHPCLVLRSMGNERYDQDYFNTLATNLAAKTNMTYIPYLTALYAEYKKQDPTRPITASSGRMPTDASLQKVKASGWGISTGYVPGDFHDVHNYQITWMPPELAEDPEHRYHPRKFYDAYALDAGANKVVLNGETFIACILPPFHGWRKTLEDEFAPHMRDGKIDRAWFAANWKQMKPPFADWGDMSFRTASQKFGILVSAFWPSGQAAHCDYYKRFAEYSRRQRDVCAGFVSWGTFMFVPGSSNQVYGPVYAAIRNACQPLHVCLDGYFNRNLFAGCSNMPATCYVMNDTENEVTNITIGVELVSKAQNSRTPLPDLAVGSLAPAQMRAVNLPLVLPDNMPGGHYGLHLTIRVNGAARAENEYAVFIMNARDIRLADSGKRVAVGLYHPPNDSVAFQKAYQQLAGVLTDLKAPFLEISSLNDAKPDQVIIVPAYSRFTDQLEMKKLEAWIKAGGRAVFLPQDQAPAFAGIQAVTTGQFGFMTELIVPDHPLFAGLIGSDFSFWNGDARTIRSKWLLDYCLLDLNEGVLACMVATSGKVGMSLAEFRLGRGSCLFVQLDAVGRYKQDSVATRFVLNLLNYAYAAQSATALPEIRPGQGKDAFACDPAKVFQVDLKPYADMGFVDPVARDGQGGWTDQGPLVDMRVFPTGKQVLRGVPFDIIVPEQNKGKTCVVLRGKPETRTAFLPDRVERIAVGPKVKRLFFLIAAAWAPREKVEIGRLRMIYKAEGQGMFGTQELPLVSGKNVADWCNPLDLPEARVAWDALVPGSDQAVGVYILEWSNPDTGREIKYIDFYSNQEAVPVLIAVTGERAD